MTYVLNSNDSMMPSDVAERKSAADDQAPSFWQRLYASILESRRRSADREIRARAYLLNEAEIVLGGFPQTALGDDDRLPFNR